MATDDKTELAPGAFCGGPGRRRRREGGGAMRKVKAWLVSDCGGAYEDQWEMPVRAFTTRAAADECARKREARGRCWDSIYGSGYCSVKEIEVVLDD